MSAFDALTPSGQQPTVFANSGDSPVNDSSSYIPPQPYQPPAPYQDPSASNNTSIPSASYVPPPPNSGDPAASYIPPGNNGNRPDPSGSYAPPYPPPDASYVPNVPNNNQPYGGRNPNPYGPPAAAASYVPPQQQRPGDAPPYPPQGPTPNPTGSVFGPYQGVPYSGQQQQQQQQQQPPYPPNPSTPPPGQSPQQQQYGQANPASRMQVDRPPRGRTLDCRIRVHPTAGLTSGLEAVLRQGSYIQDEVALYATYSIDLEAIQQIFKQTYHGWNKEYSAAKKIFGSGPASIAIRTALKTQHQSLYSSLSPHHEKVNSGADFLRMIKWGIRGRKPRFFTYVILDNKMSFSETSANFFQDKMSKHAMHSSAAKQVRYAGEFHIQPVPPFREGPEKFTLVMDNNSGTYAPTKDNLPLVYELMKHNFPDIPIEVLDREDPIFKRYTELVKNSHPAEAGDPTRLDESQPGISEYYMHTNRDAYF